MTDETRLVARAARGDREAFEALVKEHQQRVFWTAFQVVGNEEEARDVAQQVFIRLWTVLPRYRRRWSFRTWLYRITVNLAIDAYRRRQARPEAVSLASEPLSPGSGPGQHLQELEVQRIFIHLARRLTAQQRAVFTLKEMNGLGNDEIAGIMEITPSTVRNHLHQARKILRRGLATHYPEYAAAARRDQGGS